VHFPEGALSGYADIDFETFAGFGWDRLQEATEEVIKLARRLQIWVILGSAHRLSGAHKPHNSSYVISDVGDIVERYDKRFCSGDPEGRSGDHDAGGDDHGRGVQPPVDQLPKLLSPVELLAGVFCARRWHHDRPAAAQRRGSAGLTRRYRRRALRLDRTLEGTGHDRHPAQWHPGQRPALRRPHPLITQPEGMCLTSRATNPGAFSGSAGVD